MDKERHILVVGSMRPTQEELFKLGNIRTTNLLRIEKLKNEDKKHHQRVIGLKKDNIDEWIACASSIHKLDPFDYIVAYHEFDQEKASMIAESIGLKFHAYETIILTRDKLKMREKLSSHNVNSIPYAQIYNIKDVFKFIEKYNYPVIIKPRSGWASENIIKIFDNQEFEFKRNTIENLLDTELLIEKFIEGKEYSVEAISEDGNHYIIGVTEKYKNSETFVEMGHSFPADLDQPIFKEIENYIKQILDVLGIKYGPTHTEIIISNNGPIIVETHTRSAGDLIPSLINDVFDINLYQLIARQSIGEKIGEEFAKFQDPKKYATILYKTPEKIGEIIQVNGVEEAKIIVDGIKEIGVLKNIGDKLGPVNNSFDRAFFIRAVGSSIEESLQRCQNAAKKIEYKVCEING